MDIKDKIQKLLAKAFDSSCTEAEAEAFLAKARELMDRHGLSEDDIKDVAEDAWRTYEQDTERTKTGRPYWHPVDKLLGNFIAKFCGVVCYIEDTDDGKRRTFHGLEQEVELCQWILAGLRQKFEHDWRNYRFLHRKSKGVKSLKSEYITFSTYFADTIRKRLGDFMIKTKDDSGTALVTQKYALAMQNLNDKGIFIGGFAMPGKSLRADHAGAAAAGIQSAQSANLGRGVQQRTLAIGNG